MPTLAIYLPSKRFTSPAKRMVLDFIGDYISSAETKRQCQVLLTSGSAGLDSSPLGWFSSPENKNHEYFINSFYAINEQNKIILLYTWNIWERFEVPPSSGKSDVHKVRLSLKSCMIKVLSLYDSSLNESNSAIASSKACLAKWQALQQLSHVIIITYFLHVQFLNEVNTYYIDITFRENS